MTLHQLSLIITISATLTVAPAWAGQADISGAEPMNTLVGEWEGTDLMEHPFMSRISSPPSALP